MKINEYLQYHDKGAGEACQASFFVSSNALPKVCYARDLINWVSYNYTNINFGVHDLERLQCNT
ncbi:hypothetical protein OZD70_00145 [Wolbachia endosymbiont of Drosophila tsacasi]|nr:hypothetical protein [Wolbachia endosymbiont of Drosophila tsacasi]